jgi:hypothetical protein
VKLENKGGYWWGSETTIERKLKPKDEAAGSGSAGSGSGKGSASEPEYIETGRKTREFPVGENADKLVKNFAAARALRDLGKPNDEQKKDYKLNDAKTTLTVTFKDGPHTFLVGGSVYGGSDKYVVDEQTGHAYVLSRDLVSSLEIGESSLHLTDPRGFDATKVDSVTIEAGTRSKAGVRVTSQGTEGHEVKTWGDADTKKPNQTLANFIDNANNLRPTEYDSTLEPSDMTQVMKLTYKDERGTVLGTLTLYKHEKPGTLPEGQELDPANPPKSITEYYIMTEKTRVPGLVRMDTAQRTENDIDTVMNSKGSDAGTGSGSGGSIPGKPIEPHGNPFGPIPKGAIKDTPPAPGPKPEPAKAEPGKAPAPKAEPAKSAAPAPAKAPAGNAATPDKK